MDKAKRLRKRRQNGSNCENVLPKSRVMEAIEMVSRCYEKKPVGRKAKLAANYDKDGVRNVHRICANRSHLPSQASRFTDKCVGVCRFHPVLNELRLCLLAGDWDNYKELLLILFSSPNINKKYILFLIRSCFVLLFNHPYCTPDLLDNFMTTCLRINETSKRIQYLRDCFLLKTDPAFTSTEETQKEEKEEEEETYFYSDYSCIDEDV